MAKQKYVGDVLENGTGAILLAVKKDWKDYGRIVLCLIPKRREFVTWWAPAEDLSKTVGGNYYMSLQGAMEDFNTRS